MEEIYMDRGHDQETRRRGKELEEAILHAAWDELQNVGYTHLTMEAVAAKSGTSKASLYRRWPSRAKIVLAALRLYGPKLPERNPDTGSLREDLIAWLTGFTNYLQTIGMETIRGLIAEQFTQIPGTTLSKESHSGIQDISIMLEHAKERGEIQHSQFAPRILSLPINLLQHELLISNTSLSYKAITEIVDDIFMPLVTGQDHSKVQKN
jgi:AcrR family transcriptional regulator